MVIKCDIHKVHKGFFNEYKWYHKVHKGSSKVGTYELPHMHHEYVASAYITWHRGIILIYSVSKYGFDYIRVKPCNDELLKLISNPYTC